MFIGLFLAKMNFISPVNLIGLSLLFVNSFVNEIGAEKLFYNLIQDDWELYKIQYNKVYQNESEEYYRFGIFTKNLYNILKHNEKEKYGGTAFKLTINQFADWTISEFQYRFHCLRKKLKLKRYKYDNSLSLNFESPTNLTDLPETIDWRIKGAVTAVKDQGLCGSCWAFAVTGALEGQHYLSTGMLTSLSEQNLLDCTNNRKYRNHGCDGGWMINSYKYIQDNDGIDTEKGYPYTTVIDSCQYNEFFKGATLKGFVSIESGNEQQLKGVLANIGPVSVAIDISDPTFRFYSSGVYYSESCGKVEVNHAVLIVGYGSDEVGGDYWLVKNSWAETWGDSGYIKMSRNRNNNCGIASYASYPIV